MVTWSCALEHHGDRPMWYRLLPSWLLCDCSLRSVPYHPKQGGQWFSPNTTSETVGLLESHRKAWWLKARITKNCKETVLTNAGKKRGKEPGAGKHTSLTHRAMATGG